MQNPTRQPLCGVGSTEHRATGLHCVSGAPLYHMVATAAAAAGAAIPRQPVSWWLGSRLYSGSPSNHEGPPPPIGPGLFGSVAHLPISPSPLARQQCCRASTKLVWTGKPEWDFFFLATKLSSSALGDVSTTAGPPISIFSAQSFVSHATRLQLTRRDSPGRWSPMTLTEGRSLRPDKAPAGSGVVESAVRRPSRARQAARDRTDYGCLIGW